jgi:hypothetical protein
VLFFKFKYILVILVKQLKYLKFNYKNYNSQITPHTSDYTPLTTNGMGTTGGKNIGLDALFTIILLLFLTFPMFLTKDKRCGFVNVSQGRLEGNIKFDRKN